jgi:hypothetical protein
VPAKDESAEHGPGVVTDSRPRATHRPPAQPRQPELAARNVSPSRRSNVLSLLHVRPNDRFWNRLAAIVLAIASALLVSSYLHGSPALSPIDELQHFDYVVKAPGVPRAGEPIGEEAMRAQACRGINYPGFVSPPCSAMHLSPEAYQEGGQNTAYIHPPPYYFLTAAIARPLATVTPLDLYASARLTGALWLFAGLWITWCCGRRLNAGPAGLLGMLLLTASSPAVLLGTGNIGPDAAALVVGGGGLWLLLRSQGRHGVLFLAAAGALSVAFKMNHIVAIAPICTYLIICAAVAGDGTRLQRWRRGLIRAAVPGTVAAAAVLLVHAIIEARRMHNVPSQATSFAADSLTLADVVKGWSVFAPPNADLPFLPPSLLGHPLLARLNMLLASFLVLACIYVAVSKSMSRSARVIACSTLAWMLLGGPIYIIANYVMTGQVFPSVPTRYGLSLMAVLAVIAALALRPMRLQQLALATGALSVIYVSCINFVDVTVI